MKSLVAFIGAVLGFVGGIAASLYVYFPSCIVPMTTMVDMLVCPLLGAWYALIVVQSFTRLICRLDFFVPNPGWERFFDTAFGAWFGFHVAAGSMTAIEYWYPVEVPDAERFLIAFVSTILFAWFFFWSTDRSIKRTERRLAVLVGQNEALPI